MPLKVGRGAAAPPFLVMDVITAANRLAARLPAGSFADGQAVIRMEVGQPGTGAPRGAAEAAARALSAGAAMGYTEAFGLPSLRERIAGHYATHYGAAVPAARIAVTLGASGAFPLAFLAAFDPGDAVAMAAPFYPPYRNILTALGMRPSNADTSEPLMIKRKMLSMNSSTSRPSSRKYSAIVTPVSAARRRTPAGSFI